jgi:hypothetical protein
MSWSTSVRRIRSESSEAPAYDLSLQWQSRQLVITPELLGMRSTADCQARAEKLGFTQLPPVARHQEHWRLDELLAWSRANGLDRLPALGQLSLNRRINPPPFHVRAK